MILYRKDADRKQSRGGSGRSDTIGLFDRVLQYFKEKKKSRIWRIGAMMLAVAIVFFTSYGLILPAITLEKDKAKDMSGIYLASDSSHDEEQRTSDPGHAGGETAGEEDVGAWDQGHVEDADDSPAEKEKEKKGDSYSQEEESGSLGDKVEDTDRSEDQKEDGDTVEYMTQPLTCRSLGYEISMALDSEARIPVGTQLTALAITKGNPDYKIYEEALQKKNAQLIGQIYYQLRLTYKGKEIRPAKPVDITFTSLYKSEKKVDYGVLFRKGKSGLRARMIRPEYEDDYKDDEKSDGQLSAKSTSATDQDKVSSSFQYNQSNPLSIKNITYNNSKTSSSDTGGKEKSPLGKNKSKKELAKETDKGNSNSKKSNTKTIHKKNYSETGKNNPKGNNQESSSLKNTNSKDKYSTTNFAKILAWKTDILKISDIGKPGLLAFDDDEDYGPDGLFMLSQVPLNQKRVLNVIGLACLEESGDQDSATKGEVSEKTDAEEKTIGDEETSTIEDKWAEEGSTEQEESYPAQSFQAQTDCLTISVEAEEGALPKGAVMRVREVYNQEIINAVTKTVEESGKKDDVAKKAVEEIQAVDITFTDKEANEVEPRQSISVTIGSKLVKQAKKSDKSEIAAVHLDGDGKGTIVETETDQDKLHFDSDAFSVYALVKYTVDFTYEGRTWSFPGQGSYRLAVVLATLGIEGNIDDAALTLIMGEEHAGALYLTQSDGDYYINSDIAFTDTYELRVRIGEKIYIITVTDTQTSADLSDFLKNAVITGATQDPDGNYHVESGEEYTIILTFAEDSNYQFDNTRTLTYQMPAGIKVLTRQEKDGNINIVYKGRTYQVSFHYVLDTDGSLQINFDTSDPDFPRLEESTNVSFRFTYTGEFDGTTSEIKFNDVIERDITFDEPEPGQAYAEKEGEFDEATGKINYTIRVTATGDVTNVNVKDLISGNALIFNNDVLVSGNSDSYTANPAANGFDYTFQSMNEGEVITITYSCGLNFSLDTDKDGKLSVDQTKNTVTVEPEDGDPHTSEYSREIVFQSTTKSDGAIVETDDGDRIIEWTIENNKLALASAAGNTITDRISSISAQYMKYYGSGITVEVYDHEGNKVETREVSYNNLTAYSDDSWTYTIPDEDTTPYKYVITYKTKVDMDQIEQGGVPVTLSNNANYDFGQIVVTPSDVADITKRVSDQTEDYVEWESVITVPENGLGKAEVIDVFPAIWMPHITGNYSDNYNIYEKYIAESLDIQGLLEGESYTLEITDTDLKITFYRDSAKNQAGLQPHQGGHQITIKLKTEVNPAWLKKNYDSPGDNNTREHVNRISINGREATATALFSKPSLVKKGPSGIGTWTDWNDGQKKYKYLRYEIWLKGVKNEPVTVTDRFDTSILKLVDQYVASSDHANLYEHMVLTGGDYTDQAYDKATPVSYTDTADGFSITIDQLPRNNDGQFYQNYKIVYYLQLKDGVDLEQLAIANGGEYDLTNTAVWNGHESSFTYKTKYDFLNKELLNAGQLGAASRKAKYQITFNSAKATLNDGEPMKMTDVMSANLSVDYSSIKIVTDPVGQAVPYSLSGGTDENGHPDGTTVATYTVPDSTKVVITYDADVRGNGSQTIVNKVSVNDEDETTTTTKSYGTFTEGEGAVASFKIVKVDGYDANKKLKGVRFKIFAENPGIDFGEKVNHAKELFLVTDENGEITLDGDLYDIYFNECYHVQEVEALEDYGTISFDYLVTLTNIMDQVDYNHYVYYYSDSMQIKNWPLEGLVVEKQVESTDNNDKEQNYQFRISILNDDGTVNTNYNDKNGDDQFENGIFEFQLKDKEQKMFWGFRKGTKYRVEEIDSKGLTVSVTYSVFNEEGTVTDNKTENTSSHSGTLTQENEVIIFKNSKTTDFEFTKIWRDKSQQDTTWPPDKTITVTFNASAGEKEKVFEDQTLTFSPTGNLPEGWERTTNEDGKKTTFKITGLAAKDEDGNELKYYVVETKVDGYNDPGYAFDTDGTIRIKPDSDPTKNIAVNGNYIINTPEGGYELPSTGGPGTNMLTLFGLMLASLAGAGLAMRRRRKNVA